MKIKRTMLKSFNKTAIMKILMERESVYRAEISRLTGLSIPTVMKITDDFEKVGLISGIGKGVSSGGKPPELLQLIPNARFFIGVDLRGKEFQCSIINLRGEVQCHHSLPSPVARLSEASSEDATTQTLIELVKQTIDRSGVDRNRIVGIGIGVPYPVDVSAGKVVSAKELSWENFDIVTPVTEAFGLPVILENTAKVVALGERWFGHGVDEQNFAVITIGSGVGCAIITDGDIYSGTSNMSGEFGHMVVDVDGPPCRCGNNGCLEAIASVKALELYAKTRILEGTESKLAELNDWTTKNICEIARRGDPLANEALDRMLYYIAIGVTNLVNLLDIHLILMTGRIVEAYPVICEKLTQMVNRRRGNYFGNARIVIQPLRIGTNAATIGAATLLIKRLVEGGGLFIS